MLSDKSVYTLQLFPKCLRLLKKPVYTFSKKGLYLLQLATLEGKAESLPAHRGKRCHKLYKWGYWGDGIRCVRSEKKKRVVDRVVQSLCTFWLHTWTIVARSGHACEVCRFWKVVGIINRRKWASDAVCYHVTSALSEAFSAPEACENTTKPGCCFPPSCRYVVFSDKSTAHVCHLGPLHPSVRSSLFPHLCFNDSKVRPVCVLALYVPN